MDKNTAKKIAYVLVGALMIFLGAATVLRIVWSRSSSSTSNTNSNTQASSNWRPVEHYWKAQWLDNWYHTELTLKVDWSEPFYLPVNQTCRVVTEKGAKAQVRINGEDKNLAMFDEVGNFLKLDGSDQVDNRYVKRYEVRGTNTNVGKAYRIYCYPIRK